MSDKYIDDVRDEIVKLTSSIYEIEQELTDYKEQMDETIKETRERLSILIMKLDKDK